MEIKVENNVYKIIIVCYNITNKILKIQLFK